MVVVVREECVANSIGGAEGGVEGGEGGGVMYFEGGIEVFEGCVGDWMVMPRSIGDVSSPIAFTTVWTLITGFSSS